MKRTLALLVCLVLLLAALPGTVLAANGGDYDVATTIEQIQRIYAQSLEAAQVESFQGLCGLMTSMQLWHMGINTNLTSGGNGNEQYDFYTSQGVTSGGYHVTAYSSEDYTLLEILNKITRNGTQNAENILVGFEFTNTEMGGIYGHACVIHKIIDGKVYFLENYNCIYGGPEGTVNICTIEEFARFYEDWTVLDGVIHFGRRLYADKCQTFSTDLFLRTRFSSTLRSEPCLVNENYCQRLRSLSPGELLHATAVMKNPQGELYYRIDDGQQVGYVAANAVTVFRLNGEALTAEELEIPSAIEPDKPLTISGKVNAPFCAISAISARIYDRDGDEVAQVKLETKGSSVELKKLNDQLKTLELAEGSYTLRIYATAASVGIRGISLLNYYKDQLIHTQTLTVGKLPMGRQTPQEETVSAEAETRDGWFYRNGTWYCYKYQRPCTGWVTYLGIDYYLKADGSVTTGWAEVDGWNRYFTASGALCTGWLTDASGTRCWLSDGTEAEGLQEIDGRLYYFGEDYLLVTYGTVTVDGVSYEIQPDGTALELPPEETKPKK